MMKNQRSLLLRTKNKANLQRSSEFKAFLQKQKKKENSSRKIEAIRKKREKELIAKQKEIKKIVHLANALAVVQSGGKVLLAPGLKAGKNVAIGAVALIGAVQDAQIEENSDSENDSDIEDE